MKKFVNEEYEGVPKDDLDEYFVIDCPWDVGQIIVDEGNRIDWYGVALEQFIAEILDLPQLTPEQFREHVKKYMLTSIQTLIEEHEYETRSGWKDKISDNAEFMGDFYKYIQSLPSDV